MKTIIVVLAPGFEETEAIMSIDLLRRAGFQVQVAGLDGLEVTGSRKMRVLADIRLAESGEGFDALVLPGGMPGAKNLADSPLVDRLLEKAFSEKRLVAAICASPALVLGAKGYLKGRRFTCYPGYEQALTEATFSPASVVKDDQLITSRGLGTTADFAFEIIRTLAGEARAREVFEQALLTIPDIGQH